MRKRVLSFLVVLVLVFTGAFSCFASAASRSPGQYLFDKYWELIHKAEQEIEDIWNIGRESREDAERDLRQILFDQKNAAENPPPSSSYSYTYICSDGRAAVYDISPDTLRSLFSGFDGCYLFAYISSAPFDYAKNYTTNTDLGNLVVYAVPVSSADSVSSSFSGSAFSLTSSSITYYRSEITFTIKDGSPFLRNRFINSSSGSINLSASYSETSSARKNIFLYSEFGNQPLTFSSILDASGNSDVFYVDLMTNRLIISNVDGSFLITAGILYDDDFTRTYAAGFVKNLTVSSGDWWGFSFDLDEFAEYVYRKRCGLAGYYGFVAVHQGDTCVYAAEIPLDFEKPGGIFDDVEDPPNWEDYRPDPTPAPEFPTITFDFHPNVSYQAIANYSVDANATFNDYFTYFVDASTTINNNINIATENIIEFGEAFSDFINDSFNDVITYIGDTITVVNSDIISNIDAIGEFIGDLVSSINFNAQLIIDNLKKYFDTKFIPDSEYIDFLLSDCIGWYSQIQGLLAEKDFSADSFTLYLAPFDYTFVFDDAELAGYIKSFCNVMCLAFTAIQCVRIGFQIFGISLGGDSNDP